ncbi:uncharacterized protein LOC126175118 [Schistocerca cancellata]|uniref:uncharacterized protein LOC126175118 n=1 Tax=Schistocerca cancellata TaxID=274614 RepID=UPI002117ED35|nr:uncharacterized protein LOC126175118 [Schistocerca cancellata]
MATTKRLYVFATFWLACASTALVVAAFSTGAWLTAELLPPDAQFGLQGDINYGLYTGSFRRRAQGDLGGTTAQSTIYITCVVEQNACAWSCKETEEERQEEILWLLANRSLISSWCPTITERSRTIRAAEAYLPRLEEDDSTNTTTSSPSTSDFPFINMGLWVSTQLFLSISLLLSAASAVLGLINTTANPTLPALAVSGLFYWNAGAAVADLLILILWGVQYAVTLAENVAFAQVIAGQYLSDGHAALGYSYWLVLVAMFINISSIAVLGFREYLLRIEPPPPTINPDDQNTDGAIFLY